MIPVPEEGSTATAMHNSKTQVTRTATFFKEIRRLTPLGQSTTYRRDVSALPGQPGKTDQRSGYFADSQGISNSIPLQTKTKKGTKGNILFNAREGNNLIRSGKSLEEGCYGIYLSTKRLQEFLSNIFIVKKEGWRQQTCDQLEGVKPIYYFPTFQNGGFTVAEISLAKKRVHVQTRLQGRIFPCPTFSGRPKESDVSMGRNPVPVSMLVF